MEFYKKVVQKMEKYISTYSSGSIIGRSSYTSKKRGSNMSSSSIFGAKVYKNHEERSCKCKSVLKRFQK